MNSVIKLLCLVFVLSLTTMARTDDKACAEDGKKECCKESAEEATDSTTEVTGEERVHVCTPKCVADPHSCPNHSHEDHAH